MIEQEVLVQGLHHITLVTSNEEINRRFYTEVLDLRRVKLTVNQDDIYHRHLFYADEKGTVGSSITFFEWPHLPAGWSGLGSPHHLAYTVTKLDTLPKWKAWLRLHGVDAVGPIVRKGHVSLYFRDPDGVVIEIAGPNDEVSQDYIKEMNSDLPSIKEVSPEMRFTTFSHVTPITTDPKLIVRFFNKILELEHHFTITNPDQKDTHIVSIGNVDCPDFLRYLAAPNALNGSVGAGSIHHIALAVEDESVQRKVMGRLNEIGIRHSGVVDRFWFKSLYFRDPDGNLLEVATKGPGYTVDEPLEKLGSSLILPPWLESQRNDIEAVLREQDGRNAGKWPPASYPSVTSPSESLSIRQNNA